MHQIDNTGKGEIVSSRREEEFGVENATAKVSCFARAFHYNNNAVHIFADEAAEQLLGAEYEQISQSMVQGIDFFLQGFQGSEEKGLRLIVDHQLSPSVLGRSAYCEKMLGNEVKLGCSQYVVFAAGYDTFAIRNPDTQLTVFELDLPEMSCDKKRRIEAAGLRSGAVFVPCDLSNASWADVLINKGFQRHMKSFGSLLGISYYLSGSEFRNLLKAYGDLVCEGSAICFDYPLEEGGLETRTNRTLAQGAGEQMKAQYAEKELEELLAECGFLVYEHLNYEEMTEQFFVEYNRNCPEHKMEAPKGVGYVLAVRKAGYGEQIADGKGQRNA